MKATTTPTSKESVKLSAPWDILFNKITATIGADPTAKTLMVDESESVKIIKIAFPEYSKAVSTATVLIPQYTFGEITVKVQVFFDEDVNEKFEKPVEPLMLPTGIPTDLATLVVLNKAFHDNPFYYLTFPPCIMNDDSTNSMFKTKVSEKCKPGSGVLPADANLVVVFRKIVVNYFSDDISDFFLSTNEVPSTSFGSIMNSVIFGKSALTFTQLPKIGIDNE